MRFVLFVSFAEPKESVLPKAPNESVVHIRRMHEFHARGDLLMSGAFNEPGKDLLTMGIFATRASAEEFARGDPFVLGGIADGWEIREWNDALAESR